MAERYWVGTSGLVTTNSMDIKNIQCSTDNTWISYSSVDSGNNYKWYFNNFNKPTSCLFYGSHV